MSKAWEWAPPTLQQELERKSFETLDWLIAGAGLGKLSEAQFSTGLDTLSMAVNGLVRGQEFIEVMSAASKEADVTAVREHRVLIQGDDVLVLTWQIGESSVQTAAYKAGTGRSNRTYDYDSPAKAKTTLGAMVKRLKDSGFMEI